MTLHQTILAVEFDPHAAATYAANMPDVEVRCCKVRDAGSLPIADIILGGPPCQSFSLAGKGLGESDDRNGWPEYVEAVRQVKPRMFLAENVPGMLVTRHIRYTHRVIAELESLGYRVEMRELDAVNYGAPQFRRRVWIWGIRSDVKARHLWPKPTHTWPPPEADLFGGVGLLPAPTVGEALGLECARAFGGGRNHPADKGGHYQRDERDITDEPSTTIPVVAGALHGGPLPRVHEYRWSDAMLTKHPPADPDAPPDTVRERRGAAEGLLMLQSHADPPQSVDRPAPALRSGGDGHDGCRLQLELDTKQHRTRQTITLRRPRGQGMMERHGQREDSEITEPSPTIAAGQKASGPRIDVCHAGIKVRRLTPAECARLQSMPDDFRWPAGITKTAQYRIIGNGWNCAIAAALGRAFAAADPASRTVIDLFSGGGLGAVGWHQRWWRID